MVGKTKLKTLLVPLVILIGFYCINQVSYKAFHTLVESAGILMLLTVVVLAYNAYPISRNHWILFFGIVYCFVSIFDILHLFFFQWPGVFNGNGINLSAYFTLASKYIEGVSLALIPYLCVGKSPRIQHVKRSVAVYTSASCAMVFLIFLLHANRIYPYNGMAPNLIKTVNEGIITVLISVVLFHLVLRRNAQSSPVYSLMVFFMVFRTLAQLFFFFTTNAAGVSHALAHIFRLISFYFVYLALVETSLKNPINVLFNDLHRANLELEMKSSELLNANQQLIQEIQERSEAESMLRQSNERYDQLIRILPDGLFIHTNGIVTYANPAGLEMVGASDNCEIVGKPAISFVPVKSQELVKNRVDQLMQYGGTAPVLDEKLVRLDGTAVDVEVVAAPFAYNGEVSVLCIMRNIAERKKAEELRRKMYEQDLLLKKAVELDKLKTEFFSNISHELRTPLNVILSTLQLSSKFIESKPLSVDMRKMAKYYSIMNQNCRRLLKIVNNLIDISRIDAGFLEPHFLNCNIVEVVEDITLSVSDFIESKGISLVFDTEAEEVWMACDPEKIERIMLNLLTNATKFTNAGGSIMVSLSYKGNHVVISIKDTGIGIPKDMQDLVFERFRQVDQSLTRNHEGSGIGLSLVKSLVEMHGGTISLISESGIGSTFTIELPTCLNRPAIVVDAERRNALQASRIERIKVEFSDIYQYSS